MESYREQVDEFEENYTSVIDQAVIDISKNFDEFFVRKRSDLITLTIKTAVSMLDGPYNIPTKMQISYDIANAYSDLRSISQDDDESHLEKELYYYRKTLDIYESNFGGVPSSEEKEATIARYVAMRAYTNLGNAFRVLGRYIVAIDCYQNALLISNDFAMASLNLSMSLFYYAQLQIKSYEQNYYHHACFYYYEQTSRTRINLENEQYLEELRKYIMKFDPSYIENFLKKPLNLPLFQIHDPTEIDYRNYILMSRLFLEPCLEILSAPCFAVDSLTLPIAANEEPHNREFIGLFNQIKQEYNLARYLWYRASATEEDLAHFSDNELDLVDTGDNADFSLQEGLLRTAFKSIYSVFDRIGFFINAYFHVGLTDTKISFKNVWKDVLRDEKGSIIFQIPNPIVSTYKHNPLIKAMFWLQKDFFENRSINITDPCAEPIFQMRNDMEHNCLRSGTQTYHVDFTKYTTKGKIENNTYKLLRLARELIIYLCLAIAFENRWKQNNA